MLTENFPPSPDCEIVSSREFSYPQELIYVAWTQPEHLKNWWGPNGFTNTFHEFDLRPGGKWKFTMHGPEKGNYQNECEFVKIEPPSFISWKRYSKPLFRVEVSFKQTGTELTEVVFKQIFDNADECSKIKKFVVDKNEENFDRLEIELRKMQTVDRG